VNPSRALGSITRLLAAEALRLFGNCPLTNFGKPFLLLGASVDGGAAPVFRAVFFGGSPYFLGVDVSSKAGHHLTLSAEHDDARIAYQVERVAREQLGEVIVVKHALGSSTPRVNAMYARLQQSVDEEKYEHIQGAIHRPAGIFLRLPGVARGQTELLRTPCMRTSQNSPSKHFGE